MLDRDMLDRGMGDSVCLHSFADTGKGRDKDALQPVAVHEMAAAEAVFPINEDLAMPMQQSFRDGRFRNGCLHNAAGASRQAVDPSLERGMRRVVLFGMLLVIALPAARGHSPWFGALPLWLLGMPLASWWALHRFRLPRVMATVAAVSGSRRRGAGRAQARRRVPAPRRRQGMPHAA